MNAKSFGAITITTIVAVVFIATINTYYQRETTSMEEKYSGRSSAEIDDLYHQSYFPADSPIALSINEYDGTYSDNIKTTSTGYGLNNDLHAGTADDWDGDGWDYDTEEAKGTQPDNPDSDGDGIIDSQDPAPLNFDIGGAITPPLSPSGEEETGVILVTNFYKKACLVSAADCTNDNNYLSSVDVNSGELLKFKLHFELQNTGTISHTIKLFDDLAAYRLQYILNSAKMQVNDNPIFDLKDDWDNWLETNWESLLLSVKSGQTKSYNIWFEVRVLIAPTSNTADLWSAARELIGRASITIE